MPALFRKLSFVLFCFATFNSFLLKAQSGSPVIHRGKTARINSDSTAYQTSHYKPLFVSTLPGILTETSGLLFFNNQLWSFNDSGNKPEIYMLDSAGGMVLRAVVIRNQINTDWESITQDNSNVYIGDFGNNAGNRTDLRILKIAKTDLLNLVNDTVQAGIINFSYPDQTDFASAMYKNNFDCEAFFCHNDSLHLFSKNWSDKQTKHYVLPVDTGTFNARLAEQFNAEGLITDASINNKGSIVLLGYKNVSGRKYTCFTWLLAEYEGFHYFSGSKRKVELGSAWHLGQTEGIVLKNDNTGWISSESIRVGAVFKPAKLFRFDFGEYF